MAVHRRIASFACVAMLMAFAPFVRGAEPGRAVTLDEDLSEAELMPIEVESPEFPADEAVESAAEPEFLEATAGPEPADLPAPSAPDVTRPPQDPKPTGIFSRLLGDFMALGSSGEPDSADRLRFVASLNGGYDTNVLASTTAAIGSYFTSAQGGFAYIARSPRYELSAGGSGGMTFYDRRPGRREDFNGRIELSGNYRFSRRLQVRGSANIAYLSQPDPIIVGGSSSFQGDYIASFVAVDLSYALRPTLSLRPAYSLNAIRYTDQAVNQQSGFSSHTFSLTSEFLMLPTLRLTAEYRFNPVFYFKEGEGSQGHIGTLGFIKQFSPRLRWEFQGGAEFRRIENPFAESDTTYLGPFVESLAVYHFAPASSVNFSIRYGTEPSGVAGTVIRQTGRGSLSAVHNFYGRLRMEVGVAVSRSLFDQPAPSSDFEQTFYAAFLSARYRIANALFLSARYNLTSLESSPGQGYDRNITTIGIDVTF